MVEKVHVFLKMFEMELEDLHKDIELLIAKYKDEHDHQVISNYVFLENVAVMDNELFGVDSFLEEVRSLDGSGYSDVITLIHDLTRHIEQRCHERGIAMAVAVLAERKMKKVLAYIEKNHEYETSS